MTLIDSARVIAAIESDWEETCCDNRNEDVCESCRAYAGAIRTIEWIRDHPAAEEAS